MRVTVGCWTVGGILGASSVGSPGIDLVGQKGCQGSQAGPAHGWGLVSIKPSWLEGPSLNKLEIVARGGTHQAPPTSRSSLVPLGR